MRKTVRAIFDSPEYLKSEDVAQSAVLKELIKQHLPIAIETSIVGNKIYAPIFEINDTSQYVEIHKNHWVQALETCLVWYVEEENYEMCNHIKNLIQSIQEKEKNSRRVLLNKKSKDGSGV
jgi:hypothetical protein